MRLDHTNRDNLCIVADRIMDLPPYALTRLNAYVASEGMMRTHFWIEWSFKAAAWLKRGKVYDAWLIFFRNEEPNLTARDTLIEHMLDGTDRTDPNSAGGFNREEFAAIITIVELLEDYAPERAA